MKNITFFIPLFFVVASCNDEFLERYPLDEASPQTFFRTEEELNAYINGLYDYLPGSNVFSRDGQSDNVASKSYNIIVAGQHTVETDAGAAGWTWDYLRDVNFFLENYGNAEVPEEDKNHYAGIARFFRAWFYFDKVSRFGDVPWYSGTLETGDPELYKGRDPRKLVMDSVLADLDFAAAHIQEETPEGTINKWCALALKARVCLHEGTFRKYHGLGDENKFLEAARDAARAVIDGGAYAIYTTGDIHNDYRDLFTAEDAIATEVILVRKYDYNLGLTHTANGTFITPTLGGPGLTKSLVDAYLNADGTPFTFRAGADTATFYYETLNRDPRLQQTIRTPGYTRIGQEEALVPDFDNARTGYQCIKFVTSPEDDSYNTNTNDLPLFRYAEVLLIYAEARAELGELNQADLDMSVNLLRDRAGMPHMRLAGLASDPVLENRYLNVNGLQKAAILEIRRERRVELAMEGFRYQDLMRWKSGPLLAKTFKGMYFPRTGEFDMDRDGDIDIALVTEDPDNRTEGVQYLKLSDVFVLSEGDQGNIIVHPDIEKEFDEKKHYYFPLPRTELLLNENLEQNPGWE